MEHALKNKFTQLASLLNQQKRRNTLGGQVDDSTVRQFRLALRRKYAARSNLPRIWAQWCKDP